MFYLSQKKASIIVLSNNENDLLTAVFRMFPVIARIVLPDYTDWKNYKEEDFIKIAKRR